MAEIVGRVLSGVNFIQRGDNDLKIRQKPRRQLRTRERERDGRCGGGWRGMRAVLQQSRDPIYVLYYILYIYYIYKYVYKHF